jgi:hypothetical protein
MGADAAEVGDNLAEEACFLMNCLVLTRLHIRRLQLGNGFSKLCTCLLPMESLALLPHMLSLHQVTFSPVALA